MADTKYVGQYEIKERLGQGGMAAVFRAHDSRFNRDVAIKLLPTQMRHDTQFRIRFEREAMAIAGLEHPAIVPVYDYGEDEGQVYLVMRLMDGGTLASRINRGPISPQETRRILARIAPAIDFAHQQGIVHRDLKPANILFDRHGEPYLTDFGIVKLLGGDNTAVTATGGMIGTPGYMSPEQARGEADIDGRTDVYSLGVVCFEMLSGELPFQADSAMSLALMHITEAVPSLRGINPTLDRGYDAVIAAAMAKERGQRYEAASKFVEALSAVESGEQLLPPTFVLGETVVEEGYKPAVGPGIPVWAKAAGAIAVLILIVALLLGLLNRPGQTAENGETAAPTNTAVEAVVTQIVVATSTAEPEPTRTPEPTATAAPTNTVPPEPSDTPEPTMPAGPNLTVSRPTQQELASVPYFWDAVGYRDLKEPGTELYSEEVSSNEDWIWGFSWCAVDAARLADILTPLTIDYYIDGELLPLAEFLEFDETANNGWRCKRWRALLSGWTVGETVELSITYSLSSSINDGLTSYPPGTYHQVIFVDVN
jgi:serine/threonine-protein kinase